MEEPVRVSVQNHVVVLTGTVSSREARTAAGMLVRAAIDGVDVCNALAVAHGDDPADEFDMVVAGLEVPAHRVSCRWRARRLHGRPALFMLPILCWAFVPVVIVVTEAPRLPMILAGLALTSAILLIAGGRARKT